MPQDKVKQFRVIIERGQDGIFVASVPSLPGCHTQAKTYEKVMDRIKEAIELYVEVLKSKREFSKTMFATKPNFWAVEDLAVAI